MGVFDRQVATAIRLLKKYGELCEYHQNSNGDAPSDSPWNPTDNAAIVSPVVVCFLPATLRTQKRLEATTGSPEVPTGAEDAYIGKLDFTPSLKDTIVRNSGEVYRIFNIDTLNPNGEQDILYTLTVYR